MCASLFLLLWKFDWHLVFWTRILLMNHTCGIFIHRKDGWVGILIHDSLEFLNHSHFHSTYYVPLTNKKSLTLSDFCRGFSEFVDQLLIKSVPWILWSTNISQHIQQCTHRQANPLYFAIACEGVAMSPILSHYFLINTEVYLGKPFSPNITVLTLTV